MFILLVFNRQSQQISWLYEKKPKLVSRRRKRASLSRFSQTTAWVWMLYMWPAHSKTDKGHWEWAETTARFVKNEYSTTPGTVMIILNDLKWPTFEKRRKVTRLTTMFKVVSSLSAIQVRPCKLFKRRQGIRQFHPKTFIQVDAKKKQILTQFYCKYNQRLELVTK